MAYHRIHDAERLHSLIEAIMLIEADANVDGLLRRIVETAAGMINAIGLPMGPSVAAAIDEILVSFL